MLCSKTCGRRETGVLVVCDRDGEAVAMLADEGASPAGSIADLVEQRRGDKHFLRLLDENLARHSRAIELFGGDRQ